MEKIKEFVSQISLNKYWDKKSNQKINKKVYAGYINGELYTGYKRKKTYTKKASLISSMVEWLSERYILEELNGRYDYKLRDKITETLHDMMPQFIEEGIIEIKEVELVTE